MKLCTACNKEKEEIEFSFRNTKKGTRQAICKICASKSRMNYYFENQNTEDQKHREYRKEQKNKLIEYKKTLKCKCGESRWWVLEFHHDGNDKLFNVANKSGVMSFERLLEEIKKCDILCANCHRDLHYQQKNESE